MSAMTLDPGEEAGHGSGEAAIGQPLFTPTPERIAASQLTAFCRRLRAPDPAALERLAIDRNADFWTALLDWLDLPVEGEAAPAIAGDDIETARFFPNLRLNYAEALLRGAAETTGLRSVRAGGQATILTRGELRARVERLAGGLTALGLKPGDGVAAVLRNDVEAVVAALAVAACGGVLATAAPDMGAAMLAARLVDLEPRLLLTVLEPRSWDTGPPPVDRVAELARLLPTLEAVVALDQGPAPAIEIPLRRAADIPAAPLTAWPRLPFNHPLFVLFSSGTTGRPKGFAHGAGGTLLEHLKEHRLHGDLTVGDRLFFQTSPAWMMWHWQLSALACGGQIVLYDGPVEGPETLWRIVEREAVTVFGTSPPYLRLCASLGYRPGEAHDLSALRAVLSTGSVLQPDQALWVRDAVANVPVQSISGGSDMIGCFVLGNPNLAVWPGEAQCRSLGLDVRQAEDGELVCANAFPSRPLRLLADPDGRRFHDAYFARRPGMWSHGDRIEITPRGGVIMRGRLDGVLNIRGVRVGPAEIYAALAAVPEVLQALAVEQAGEEAGDEAMVLLIVLAPGAGLDAALETRIRRTLIAAAGQSHSPERIVAVAALPTTHSGKLSEAAAADALNGRPVANRGALRNPESLDAIAATAGGGLDLGEVAGETTVDWLMRLWASLLPTPPASPDDNFFDLGGHSLMAARLLTAVRRRTGRALPMAALLHAPTARALATAIDDPAWTTSGRLAPMAAGQGDPLFIVHSMTGNVLQLHGLARAMRSPRPVVGIQARGLEPGEAPFDCVQAMAEDYLVLLRSRQAQGPYHLCGFSFGGLVAYEMARRLEAAGETVALLVLLDSHVDKAMLPLPERVRLLGIRLAHHARRMAQIGPSGAARYFAARLRALAGNPDPAPPPEHEFPPRIQAVRDGILAATRRYRPGRYLGPVLFVRPRTEAPVDFDATAAFRGVAPNLKVVWAAGDHDTMIEPPHVDALADLLRLSLLE